MTDQQFRRLTREDLIEIIYELKKDVRRLETENEQLKGQLSEKQMKIENAGSIAEASLALHGVFEAAQAAADQYLEQVQAANEQTQRLCDRLIADAQRKADAIVTEAQQEADAIVAMTDDGAQQKWAEWQKNAETMMKSYEALRLALQK